VKSKGKKKQKYLTRELMERPTEHTPVPSRSTYEAIKMTATKVVFILQFRTARWPTSIRTLVK